MRRQLIQCLLNEPLVTSSLKKLINIRVQRLPHVFIRLVHNNEDIDKSSVTNVANHWRERFENEGISEPSESINHIIAHVLGTKKITNLNEKRLNQEQLEKLDMLCNCRLSRMPVQYIIGEWDFRDITLKLEPPIFIPRPETEILVECLLKRINDSKNKENQILEIGCGSGAISLSLLQSNRNVNLTAIDINPHACELTLRNARDSKLQDRLVLSNAKLKEDGTIEVLRDYSSNKPSNNYLNDKKFDFIVSNPPYIPTKKIFKLQPEIRVFEDIQALDGGEDGLQLIKSIIKYASEALCKDGYLILEADSSHPDKIKSFIEENYSNELKVENVLKDYRLYDRFVEILKI